jgi:hypothetical protein
VGGVTDEEHCAVHTVNIISQRQCFVARCFSGWFMSVVHIVYAFVFLIPAS